jgi:hypothetical protein
MNWLLIEKELGSKGRYRRKKIEEGIEVTQEDEEEILSSYWMIVGTREDTRN